MSEAIKSLVTRLTERANSQKDWLIDNAPFTFEDQKHFDPGTPERAYWVHGYMMGLFDAIKLMDDGNDKPMQ